MKRFPQIESRELFYPANLLTIGRLLLIPSIITSLAQRDRRRAFTLLSAALFSDIIDGPIARHRGEVSNLGKILDPIADKLLLNGSAMTLSRAGELPCWVAALLLLRDLAILLGGLLIYTRHMEIRMALPFGKATTVAFGAVLLTHLALGRQRSRPILWIAILLMGGSVVQYGRLFLNYLSRVDGTSS